MRLCKLIILFLFLEVFLVSGALAEECTIARPYFGSVNCEETSWSQEIEVYDGQEWTCDTENCEIRGITPNDVTCTGMGIISTLQIYNQHETKIVDCNSIIHPLGDECASEISTNKDLRKGDKITIDFSCNWGAEPEGNPRVLVRYKKLELELNIDSGSNIIPNTEFCNVNEVWDSYSGKQLPNNNDVKSMTLSNDPEIQGSDGLSVIPSSTNLIKDLEPSQLDYKEGYWFIYDWVERPSLIMGTFENKNVWCNPIDHSLTELEEVNTRANDCYFIPTTKLSTKVSCCSSGECKGQYKNQEVFCTDDFKCGFEKSCFSDSNCGSSERCQAEKGRYFLVNSYCDKNELDDYNKGSCKVNKQEVLCCNGQDGGPNVCASGEYCDYDDGCKEVAHETSEGKIKTGVGGINQENIDNEGLSSVTENVVKKPNQSSPIIAIIIGILLLIGVIGAFYYFKSNKGGEESSEENITNKAEKFCEHCGSPLSNDDQFCTECGKKS